MLNKKSHTTIAIGPKEELTAEKIQNIMFRRICIATHKNQIRLAGVAKTLEIVSDCIEYAKRGK